MAKAFETRAFDNIQDGLREYYDAVDYGYRNRHDNGNRECFRGKYAVAAYKIKKYEEVLFSEWDLRGLTAVEKDFIRDNGMKNYVDIKDFSYSGNTERVYLVIRRNSVGRKTLYGFMKKQWIDLNAHYHEIFGKTGFNYDKQLIFTPGFGAPFSKYRYEVNDRASRLPYLF